MSAKDSKTWTLQALTNIWTGDADGKPDRVITTGMLGSIRWWFEVLVRGLGGRACDPTSPVRCPDSGIKDPTKPGHHCVVCELFGCTGWARKFRFAVLKIENGREKAQISQIAKDDTFVFRFTELRPIQPEEWALLDLTLGLIAHYGAIGGKTKIRKKNNGIGRRPNNGLGRVCIESGPSDLAGTKCKEISSHLRHNRWHQPNQKGFEWSAADKLEGLPKEHRNPEGLVAHLRSNSSKGRQ
jgi:CRISPR-associated protein Cmr1